VSATAKPRRQRVPAAQRRDALIDAAMIEFAQAGLHGTPVDRIARRVGVAQPYVFSLFPSKRDLFIAAVERGFHRVADLFTHAAEAFDPQAAGPDADVLAAMGMAYIELVESDRALLMLQHHAYAACEDETIRAHVRAAYARLVAHVQRLSGASPDRIDEFMRIGMWLNVQAAMAVEDLSSSCEWIRKESEAPR
jgi:AcrR family transcriptional regulator